MSELLASAAAWRLGMQAQASAALARAVDGLLGAPDGLATSAAPILVELLRAQERGDAIGMADRLEFELVPALTRARAQPASR